MTSQNLGHPSAVVKVTSADVTLDTDGRDCSFNVSLMCHGPKARGGGGELAPSFGTHCEPDPKSGSGDKQRQ